MNRKKWLIGFSVAILFGLLNAGAGLAGDMNWKSFCAVLCVSLVTSLGAYLMKHPVEDISDTAFVDKANGRINGGGIVQDFLLLLACLSLVMIVLWFTGCASFSTTVTQTERADGTTNRTTVVKARTFFDSKSELANVKAGQLVHGSQEVKLGSLNQESSGSNAVSLLEAGVGAAVRAAIAPK